MTRKEIQPKSRIKMVKSFQQYKGYTVHKGTGRGLEGSDCWIETMIGKWSIYIVDITHNFDEVVNYIIKNPGTYNTWPEKFNMSRKRRENIIPKLKNPEIVNTSSYFKFKVVESNTKQVNLITLHKYICFK